MNSEQLHVAEVERRLVAAFRAKDESLTVGHRDYVETPRRSPRRVILPLAAAAIVLVVVATYAVVALMRSHHASPPAADGVAPQTIGRLWNLANQSAIANGTTIKRAEAVLTTAAGASRVLFDSSGSHETTQPTWAVQAETTTSFACCLGPVSPPDATLTAPRKWHFIVMAVRAATFEQVAGGYTATGRDLAQLGNVITLHDTGVPTPTPTPTLAPALVQTSLTNETRTVITVIGCPRCGPHGTPLDPHRTLHWNQRQPNAHYSAMINGRNANCSPPPNPTLGSDIAIAYRITPPGRCDP